MIETRKYLKTVIDSNIEESEKVKLLSDLIENTISYAEGLEKINKDFQQRTKDILLNRG